MPYALLSVSDKRGLVPFARGLVALGYTLLASGGTARVLQEAGIPVRPVSTVTGFPEILGGRVKTLHPAIHGGILSRRTVDDQAELDRHGIPTIDVVVVNLYPFLKTVQQEGVTLEEALENIDIGGVALLRAAAKNFPHVLVLTQPEDYEPVLAQMRAGRVDMALRRALAVKAFQHTAAYDAAIAAYLAQSDDKTLETWPQVLALTLERVEVLRYGENPHQQAARYRPPHVPEAFQQLHGKAMSYNNWLDLDAAWRASRDFDVPAVVIVKHGNPCGIGTGETVAGAYRRALASDPVSAFGSVIAVRGVVDAEAAEAMRDLFIEVLAADGFTEAALARLKRKSKNLRLLQARHVAPPAWEVRSTVAGWLLQTPDVEPEDPSSWRVVTRRAPSPQEWEGLIFAWRAVKHVKSNAIVLARQIDGAWATVGIGAGQMSRVDAVHLAVYKAGERAQGAMLASDAFFPFPDGIEAAAAAGVTAVVQPGGSKRDADVIAAADRLGLAMVFTGRRHFRH
ncbi:MAG: bifunctional phosphoribosylaminoimidazolecarboxamide formyltransferase/IMP cyclohydrolase [Chloroflexi bacterium]|nr:bifunctional phosphoribosylaminoimidazolecarboxamide formyltransferase/IMP cyclohydrolase [Chloroflexota bacterium]